MPRTTAMRLIELIVYKNDIDKVLMYLGNMGEFQFQQKIEKNSAKNNSYDESFDQDGEDKKSKDFVIFNKLQQARVLLDLPELDSYTIEPALPDENDERDALKIIEDAERIHGYEVSTVENNRKSLEAYKEACAFSNLKVPFGELESFSFLTLRIGKIDESNFNTLRENIAGRGIVVPLGDDNNRILVASSKKARFFVDKELKNAGFVELHVPKDFKGIPSDALSSLEEEKSNAAAAMTEACEEKNNYASTHKDSLYRLLQLYSFSSQIRSVSNKLDSTEYVYRITGWVPSQCTEKVMKDLDEITSGRTGMRSYMPSEIPSVVSGTELVPVMLKHGKLVSAFERMILSYGAPLYGTIDPTPLVAVFFTILFGLMFGDAGQGLVFLIAGILMCTGKMKLMGWEKFGRIFVCIGITSTLMGLLTGEFFASEEVLVPFSRYVTGLFGSPRNQILPMMPTGSAESTRRMFMFFAFTVGVGFVINTFGLIINIINQFSLKRYSKAIFGKNGLSGAIFFWYVIGLALSLLFTSHKASIIDFSILGLAVLLTAFSEPLQRLMDGEKPVFENGLFSGVIAAVVEIIELASSYISNTVSFLRVGAFALAHAVFGFIISQITGIVPGPGGILVAIFGNLIVIGLEGMIVAIQVVRLQYYEFFSKFFSEMGKAFEPFSFVYKNTVVE